MTHLVLSLSLAFAPTVSAIPFTSTPTALNQYSSANGSTQTYDTNGNLTADGSATYTFDAESRLTQVVKGGVTTSVTYDALGRRATKTVSGVTMKFLYDGAELLAETDTAGVVQARYLYGPGIDEPLELKRGTTTSSYSADGLQIPVTQYYLGGQTSRMARLPRLTLPDLPYHVTQRGNRRQRSRYSACVSCVG